MGGFCGVIVSFLTPGNIFFILGLLYLKSNKSPLFSKENVFTLIIVIFSTIIGFTSGVLTIIEMVIIKKI
jgi:hypothetical protein